MKNKFIEIQRVILTVILLFFLTSCSQQKSTSNLENTALKLPQRPNILWLVTEDLGAYIPPFGDNTIETPNLSRLANEGVIYPNLYSISGVCAPSRAAIATGMYPTSIGANNMRVNSFTEVTGLPIYEAVPPTGLKMISEWMRLNGYYCTNNYKEDYQFNPPKTAWNESSPYAHWRNREDNQPFFAVFNFHETHESGLFEPYGLRYHEKRLYAAGDRNFKIRGNGKKRMKESESTIHVPRDIDFKIPPYLPDNAIVKRDMWKVYNNIAEMDKQIGAVIKQLEDDGLLENTIIFFYGDHGGPLPREKRLTYDSGLNTPMIIRFPNKLKAGTKDDQLISFIDFAPTLLSLIGEKPKKYLQGQAFLGKYTAKNKRKYIHAAADRFDEYTDVIRAVRDSQFKYLRNYRPEQGYYLPLGYVQNIPTMQELLRLNKEEKLNGFQKQWFRKSKPTEELFDCFADPYELNNLANDPKYKDKLVALRMEMDRWLVTVGDEPNLPERDLINKLWEGKNKQPETTKPVIAISDNKITISSETEGASIGYKIINRNGEDPTEWSVYNRPLNSINKGSRLLIQAHRIGFKPSEIIEHKF
ncbi:Arylsulfatase A [Lutibacter agarilyticus]|uniref:Arylsulfatase A n=1 Tax=Lutibacter agarilyticus TaxID=1109740 RepID=A0A238Y4R8_9FLAO|nr:sulfatase [Lutibacter agarilyticus]SNR65781.1 Arylsulfatase A [Lutibacter agarilyticus]